MNKCHVEVFSAAEAKAKRRSLESRGYMCWLTFSKGKAFVCWLSVRMGGVWTFEEA